MNGLKPLTHAEARKLSEMAWRRQTCDEEDAVASGYDSRDWDRTEEAFYGEGNIYPFDPKVVTDNDADDEDDGDFTVDPQVQNDLDNVVSETRQRSTPPPSATNNNSRASSTATPRRNLTFVPGSSQAIPDPANIPGSEKWLQPGKRAPSCIPDIHHAYLMPLYSDSNSSTPINRDRTPKDEDSEEAENEFDEQLTQAVTIQRDQEADNSSEMRPDHNNSSNNNIDHGSFRIFRNEVAQPTHGVATALATALPGMLASEHCIDTNTSNIDTCNIVGLSVRRKYQSGVSQATLPTNYMTNTILAISRWSSDGVQRRDLYRCHRGGHS